MDSDGSIEISDNSVVSPSICILCTYCFNVANGLVCNMQGDYMKVVEQLLQCECWLACQVTWQVLETYLAIKDVGSFDDYEVKNLMRHLMKLALSPYWPEMC